MSVEYFIFIFLCSIAVIQAAAARRKLEFVLFSRNRLLTYILAALVIIVSYYWFFFLGGRHVRDTGGNIQLLLFPVAIILSMAFTLFLSSVINAGKLRKEKSEIVKSVSGNGIEVLREMTYWQAVRLMVLVWGRKSGK